MACRPFRGKLLYHQYLDILYHLADIYACFDCRSNIPVYKDSQIEKSCVCQMTFSINKRAKSFVYAFRGIAKLIMTQHNAWIHLWATAGVIVFGFLFKISAVEWTLIILAIVIVWMAEALNTAVEFLADSITTEPNKLIGAAKDVAAGGVLIVSIGAAIVGIIIFSPYIIKLVS
jgi:diacylglycerol kinase (ATP)